MNETLSLVLLVIGVCLIVAGVIRVDNQLVTKDEAASENADARIGRRVKLALLFHRNVNADTTIIDVKDGVVTLSGDASSVAQKALTTEYAKDIAGVKEVKNVMTVAATPAPDKRSPGEKLDDASITAQVRMALATHRSNPALARHGTYAKISSSVSI
jgi:osmotically-inducible protein OsmY